MQVAAFYELGNALERHEIAAHQRFERAVVQQRAGAHAAPAGQSPAQRQQRQPVCAAAQHAQRVGFVDLLGVHVAPDMGHAPHGGVKGIGMAGECCNIDSACRCTRKHGEGVGAMLQALFTAQGGNGLQHAHLIGGAGPATAEQQPGRPDAGRRACRVLPIDVGKTGREGG